MAGDWIKMECATPDKQEVLAIAARLGWDDPDFVVGKLFRVWRWFDQHTVDGNAPSVTKALLDRVSGVPGFSEAMESVGWLVSDAAGIRLPNFDRHCGKTAKERAMTAKRVAAHKSNGRANGAGNALTNATGNAATVTTALPREEKRREEEENPPSPLPPSAESAEAEIAIKVLEHLNRAAGRSFRPAQAHMRLITARLRECSGPADLIAVIDAKVAAWKDDPKMSEYLRPETLFSATKFASYVGSLPKRRRSEWWLSMGYGSLADAQRDGVAEPA